MKSKKKARVIAFYLPQFHPIPENDLWWGKGFTEWTNVAKAKPLFRGHYQPRVPADLGFYDLRMTETREAQADMAREAGIEGFCYWHYWFNKENQLLEKPFNEVLNSGKPDFPFCLAWANHSWSNRSWHSASKSVQESILMKQEYGFEDHQEHFYSLLKAFTDKRYIKVEGKPLFLIFDPIGFPEISEFISLWQHLAIENGLNGIHFVGVASNLSGHSFSKSNKKKYYLVKSSEPSSKRYQAVLDMGFNAVNSRGLFRAELKAKGHIRKYAINFLKKYTNYIPIDKYEYSKIIDHLYVEEDSWASVYPTLIPNWDRSPRSGKMATIYHNSTPELFKKSINNALTKIENKSFEQKILFLMSWNEWAEGNYVEPDLRYGKGYLEALRETIIT